MKINWLYKDEIEKFLTFNDGTGKYEKTIEQFKITINSWNNKVEIRETSGCTSYLVPIDLIKAIIELNKNIGIEFDEEEK